MPTKTEAITRFLNHRTRQDLASLYSYDMECQVNVAQGGGTRINGEYLGVKWLGWTDGVSTWKPIRIPYHAYDIPEYRDSEIKFDLDQHAEGIGLTGWDWTNRASKWVAFDFDAIVGHSDKHSNKLTNEEISVVREKLQDIPWVTIRRSTSGNGLHVYVHLNNILTANHNEHSALARSILGKLSALTGYDFNAKVDTCGGNMWVWHRKMHESLGLVILKQGSVLTDIPKNWRDHLKVVTKHKKKSVPANVKDIDSFESLSGQHPNIQLDDSHKSLINYLNEKEVNWWWDQDHHMLVAHTVDLKQAYTDLGFRGIFYTNSPGTDLDTPNCFAHPLREGSWVVRRFSQGCQEHESWDQDVSGWTRTYLNKIPKLSVVAKTFGGLEDVGEGFQFQESRTAVKAMGLLGADVKLGVSMESRTTKVKRHKDGKRLIVEIDRGPHDNGGKMLGWIAKKDKWIKVCNANSPDNTDYDIGNYDDLVRHLVTVTGDDYGWVIKSDGRWQTEPLTHIRVALASMGLSSKEQQGILGSSVFRCWTLVNKPFQSEYPGDREWNHKSAQLRFLPTKDKDTLNYPTWLKILNHCGKGLDDSIQSNDWAKANGIIKGADYLKCWLASLLQFPSEPLPYLFFFGEQNSGKSIFHEAIDLLLTTGYMRVDAALISNAGFNAELEDAICCVVEEIDLGSNKQAYNRIKDWVVARQLMIHPKGKTPYSVENKTHYIQCANDPKYCPPFSGDTRITMIQVDPLDEASMIPKRHMIPALEKEASDFVAELLSLEIPESNDRLNLPIIGTIEKSWIGELHKSQLELFLDNQCIRCNGNKIKFSDFYIAFQNWVDESESHAWSKIHVGRELPVHFPKGRIRKDAQFYIGNIAWVGQDVVESDKLTVKEGFLG